MGTQYVLGADIGSTTCKLIVVERDSKKIIWQKYERHHTKQAEKLLALLTEAEAAVPESINASTKIFITGSGATPLIPHIGAKFVQEVNAVAMSVEELHPKALSVVELGGQDAKIIIFKENPETGQKTAVTNMNEKCASGTGATIDKCFIKVGAAEGEAQKLQFDPTKLHHVAAKCGVFAETDIVNLVKSGVPSSEILNSLADAIVNQNLSVLTKGNTLLSQVILLGGPNTYLPFLQQCWRHRIPEIWEERGVVYDKEADLEDLIVVPKNAEFYAAFGAVLYGLNLASDEGTYRGKDGLEAFTKGGRKEHLQDKVSKPLVANAAELEEFKSKYSIPKFQPATFEKGQVVEGYIGLDGGSTSSKCVLIDRDRKILVKEYVLSKGNPIKDTKDMLAAMKKYVESFGATLNVLGFGATGYAAPVLEKSVQADVNIIETIAHMKSSVSYFGDVDVICDIGGQDIKVLFLKNGELRNFRLSNQCSAGNGMLLQAMADQFNVPIQEFAETAFNADFAPLFNYGCAVFLDSDRVNFQKEGFSKEELMAGLAQVLPKNIWQYVVQIPRLAELGTRYVLQGGTQYNQAAVKAQVDYIAERVPNAEIFVHPHCGEAGAIGAAFETMDVVELRGYSTFIGLDDTINLEYSTKNDETTICNFCANKCSRTYIDTKSPSGIEARYISGFSCDKGTVEDTAALKRMQKELKEVLTDNPNMVSTEAKKCYKHFYDVLPMPSDADDTLDTKEVKNWVGIKKRKEYTRRFQRSSIEAMEYRSQLRIGMPKALNMWVTGPFWRTFFEALGVPQANVVFSDDTSEKLSKEGMKYGSIDPCFPAKVAQAHIHNLMYKKHAKKPLNYIYFPCITRIPSYLNKIMGQTACPVVQGTPKVMRVSFTKETNYFEKNNVEYVDDPVSFTEPNYLKKQLFETWGDKLQITKDELDFAVEEGFKAWKEYEYELEEQGKEIIEMVERENRIAILMLGRPYHSDPGISHQITEEFQALGFPVLSMRSIPKDPDWLFKYFEDDLAKEGVDSPLEINDVWPENFSTNSAQKVWGAKFAARHPNIAILDLSNFKCGHDAPTYGIIDGIINTSQVPFSALHDLDQTKPAGSMKIRIKTYAYNLEKRMQAMRDNVEAPATLVQESVIADTL